MKHAAKQSHLDIPAREIPLWHRAKPIPELEFSGKNVTIYCDGGCSQNGTPYARGYGSFRVENDGNVYIERVEYPRGQTNNTAEYETLIAALHYCKYNGIYGAQIYSDSQLMINTAKKFWKTHKLHLIPLRDVAYALLQNTKAKLDWIPREQIVHKLGH